MVPKVRIPSLQQRAGLPLLVHDANAWRMVRSQSDPQQTGIFGLLLLVSVAVPESKQSLTKHCKIFVVHGAARAQVNPVIHGEENDPVPYPDITYQQHLVHGD